MLVTVFAQMHCSDVVYENLLEFINENMPAIRSEILLAQYHSSLLFNLPIPIFDYPISTFNESHEINRDYVEIQKYLKQ